MHSSMRLHARRDGKALNDKNRFGARDAQPTNAFPQELAWLTEEDVRAVGEDLKLSK